MHGPHLCRRREGTDVVGALETALAAGAALCEVPTDWPLHLLPPGQVLLTKTHAHSSRRLPQGTFVHLYALTYFYLPS